MSSLGPACEDLHVAVGNSGCAIDIDPYIASSPDHLEVANLEYDAYLDASAANHTLTFVGTLERCGEVAHGWYFDHPAKPTKAIACTAACSCLGTAIPGWLRLTLGCPRLSAPGAEPPAGPAPVCAADRPGVCPSSWGGAQYSLLKCSGLGESGLTGIDPLEVNVAMYGPTAAQRGYISYVPSPDDCAKVVEGWYFEPGQDPPRIAICPTTCACAKSQPKMGFELVYGCPRWSAL